MKRQWRIWIAFGLALGVLLAAVGSVTLTALRLDRAEAEAKRQAGLEENVRLALWRMDSALAPLIAQENARPYFAYRAFYPAERAYTKMFAEIDPDEVLLPSPLLTATSEHVLLHFQFGPDGALTSPQVPTGNMRDLAETGYTTPEKIDAAAVRLAELAKQLDRKTLLAALPRRPNPARAAQQVLVPEPKESPPSSPGHQVVRNIGEYQARARTYQQAASQAENVSLRAAKVYPATEAVHRPLWLGGKLLLARRVPVGMSEYLQGCWLDWPSIERWLLGEIRDLLPEGRLEPLIGKATDPRARVLASLPVRLLPGELPREPQPSLSPISLSLIIAWACVLVAGGAVAVLLLGAVSLSERRAAFVSAVTHELRTPLTTFQLYSEMLAEGMVADAAKRDEYLKTLRTEAERLGHLVENVLAYARLERGAVRGRIEPVLLRSLLERLTERLSRRAEQAGMKRWGRAPTAWPSAPTPRPSSRFSSTSWTTRASTPPTPRTSASTWRWFVVPPLRLRSGRASSGLPFSFVSAITAPACRPTPASASSSPSPSRPAMPPTAGRASASALPSAAASPATWAATSPTTTPCPTAPASPSPCPSHDYAHRPREENTRTDTDAAEAGVPRPCLSVSVRVTAWRALCA